MVDMNGGTGPGYVRFGPKDHQLVSIEVAEMLLAEWQKLNPAQFGAVLAQIMTGAQPARVRKPKQ